jgi:hypothetical protein
MLFVRPPDPLETHQTFEPQGFDAVGTIFALFFRIYILLEIKKLTSLISAIFSDEKIAGDREGFFSFSSKRKKKRKEKNSCGRVN